MVNLLARSLAILVLAVGCVVGAPSYLAFAASDDGVKTPFKPTCQTVDLHEVFRNPLAYDANPMFIVG
jgi:hypothetical protein